MSSDDDAGTPVSAPDDVADDDVLEDGKRTDRSPGPHDAHLVATITRLRDARGWSYEDLASRIRPANPRERWNKSRVVRLADRRLNVTELVDICRAFGISLKTLLEEADVIPKGAQRSFAEVVQFDGKLTEKSRDWLIETYQNLVAQRG